MCRLAAEFRYSETAFVRRISNAALPPAHSSSADGVFETRYFTPAAEVDLCGHATIGAFFALYADGEISIGSYTNQTKAGNLEIAIEDDCVWMELGAPKLQGVIENPDELYGVMNGQRIEGADAQIVSAGLPDILMPLADEGVLAALNPDFAALAKLSERLDVVGVHAFTTSSRDGLVHTRNFAPLFGIDEEAATGTSSGALAYYLYRDGLLKVGDEITFVQGEAMGRPSKIAARAGDVVYVGGRAVLLAKGELL
jgi:PhzF family phenazine biosynthesis protein